MKAYAALALQLPARSVENAANARAQMMAHIADVAIKMRTSAIFVQQYSGSPVKLMVLPEYLFSSFPGRVSIPDFAEGWPALRRWTPEWPLCIIRTQIHGRLRVVR